MMDKSTTQTFNPSATYEFKSKFGTLEKLPEKKTVPFLKTIE